MAPGWTLLVFFAEGREKVSYQELTKKMYSPLVRNQAGRTDPLPWHLGTPSLPLAPL